MTRSAADLAALKAELTNDPKNLGLTLVVEDDAVNAAKLSDVSPTLLVKRRSVGTNTIFNATTPLERQALTEQQARDFTWILSLSQFDPFKDNNIVAALVGDMEGMFSGASDSSVAIKASFTQPGSRIEQMYQEGLLEEGGDVTPSDIALARQLP